MAARDDRRVAQLDGVRALAALGVVVFHVWLYRDNRPRGTRPELVDQVLFHANAGLICFFVLSGYLLYGAFARAALTGAQGVATGPYLRRRLARIVPAAWVCGAGCLLLYWAVGFHDITPSARELPLFALFLQNYSLATMGDLNPVTWTLCVELAFYASLPLIGWVALRLGPRRLGAQLGLVLALIAVSPAWNILAMTQGWDALAGRALPAYMGCFGMGMLVALWAEHRRASGASERRLGAWPTAALLGAAVVVVAGDAAWHENAWWLRDGIFAESFLRPRVQAELLGHLATAAGFALLIAAAARGSGPAVRWLGRRPLAPIGVVSYGLYLWHLPLLLVVREAGLLPHAIIPRLLVVLAISLPVAAASWRWIERPWIERRRSARSADRRRAGDIALAGGQRARQHAGRQDEDRRRPEAGLQAEPLVEHP